MMGGYMGDEVRTSPLSPTIMVSFPGGHSPSEATPGGQ